MSELTITVEKNGTLIPAKFNEGTTLGQALTLLEQHPAFQGAYQKTFFREGVYSFSLIGANGVPLDTVLQPNDKISFVPKIVGG